MKLEFTKENIQYVDFIGSTITFRLKGFDVEYLTFKYKSVSDADSMMDQFIDLYDLESTDRKCQYLVKEV